MNTPVKLEFHEGYVSFHPQGEVSFAECANLLRDAIRLACDQGAARLLVDICGLTGFEPPTTRPRFFFAESLAEAATRPIKFALVCRPELLREDRYGAMIARNRGLLCEGFCSKPDAIKWLLAD